MERINETRYLSEGPTHLEYSGHVGEKEYAIKVPQHKELGDYSDKGLHRKISKENPHLHHHEVTAIVNSGGEEESHEKVEHEGKTHTHHVINYQEPRHLYNEEVEGLDEDLYKDQHPGYNEKHAAHSKAKSLHSSGHLKPEYHKDGSATIHVKPYDDTSSTRLTDRIHDDAGLNYNHPTKKIAKGITQVHHGLKYSTRSDDGGKTHSVHISSTTEKNMRDGSAREVKEEVEGLDELSRETVRTYYNKSIAQGKPIADKMKMGGGDHSSDGSDTKTLKKRAAGVTMALKRRRGEVKMSEDVDLEEGRMKDLAMDMESLSHADFKRKHRRTKQEMQSSLKSEALKGDQHKIDANKNGKVDGHDFKILRNAKKARYQ